MKGEELLASGAVELFVLAGMELLASVVVELFALKEAQLIAFGAVEVLVAGVVVLFEVKLLVDNPTISETLV